MRLLLGLLVFASCAIGAAQAPLCLIAQPMPSGDQTLDYISSMAT